MLGIAQCKIQKGTTVATTALEVGYKNYENNGR